MPDVPALTLRDIDYSGSLAAELIAEVQADLSERYGGPDETPVDPADFTLPAGVFVAAYAGSDVIGCAGLRRHGDDGVELKRMYVRAQHRRRGFARALLARLEDRAREMGASRLVMETGTEQPEAIALYESSGYTAVAGFGFYRDHEGSRSYAKNL